MEKQEYINPFRDVHREGEALKKHAQEELKKDQELREKQQIQEPNPLLEAGDNF